MGVVNPVLFIGEAIVGGTEARMLFTGTGPALADDSSLTFNSGTDTLSIDDGTYTLNLSGGSVNTSTNDGDFYGFTGFKWTSVAPGNLYVYSEALAVSGFFGLAAYENYLFDFTASSSANVILNNTYCELYNKNTTTRNINGFFASISLADNSGTGQVVSLNGAKFQTIAVGNTITSEMIGMDSYTKSTSATAVPSFRCVRAGVDDQGGVTTAVYGFQVFTFNHSSSVPYYPFYSDYGGSLFLAGVASLVPLTLRAAASQTANVQEWQSSASAVMTAIAKNGAIKVVALADSAAENSTLYYSTTASKLVWKDSGGTVNNLY